MTDKKIELSEEVKEKILLFFLKTSVPRIIAEDRKNSGISKIAK